LAEFFTSDRQGQQVPRYLRLLADHLTEERETLLNELALVAKNIDHIKTIVTMQQSYAGSAGLIEPIRLTELLEDALRINITSFERHGIVIERDYHDFNPVPLDKQRLLQILVNLIKNAKDAIKQAGVHPGCVTLRIRRPSDTHVRLEVNDNGIGIPCDMLTKIFSHGFTTKADGHGFGLHASANSARQMGGSLTAESNGPGQGATFIIELPIVPPQ
jgi:signal transduction histidine kinase